jgi:hypothetical protein
MLNNGDRVRAKNGENSQWIEPVRFVGKTESGEYVCESKGEIKRFRFCEKLKNKNIVPMDIDEIEQLLKLGVIFKHESSGTVIRNPSVKQLLTDPRVIIEDRFVTEMLWALPEDAKDGKWSRCEVEHD